MDSNIHDIVFAIGPEKTSGEPGEICHCNV